MKPTTTDRQRHYVFFCQLCRLQTSTRHLQAEEDTFIYQSTIDDRQCQLINSFSNLSNTHRFCTPLVIRFVIKYRGGDQSRVRRFCLKFFFGSKRKVFAHIFSVSNENRNDQRTLGKRQRPSFIILKGATQHQWRADRMREKYRSCYLYRHGVLPRLEGAKWPRRCDLSCDVWPILHALAGAAQQQAAVDYSCC